MRKCLATAFSWFVAPFVIGILWVLSWFGGVFDED
jgi:hypothetical protein